MYKVKVYVTLKAGVLDPQGKAVKGALHSMDYKEVQDVTIGKYMELMMEKTENMEEKVEEMCHRLLANPVIEDYRYEIEEVVPQ
ncbi:phosphoribosylformylglycinamidine synthase [Melghiribacillus thermohalophilus]|uniref:Phosphoribosylformylglycinamidine synthase subunit PurS n=1 Tax=Melghiribacillus thermohalophilus TaxID=1324956 RepID=A0A4R3MXL3_9BACI|nr:phosphoribosylformylglycinamidine synthase subunit PurS [Melghiribacillus thermohalophilus]TCT21114.1 phosphoribosylformylglycinamidine synthase [Melghiribacillus thermohalophilus]